MEDVLNAEQTDSNPLAKEDSDVVNFQRKIIPLDALNLALEELREKRLRNAAGRKKQELIVCATLVDKIPNLGGLARTAEIFAADRLVIPDLRVAKMDNFKSISVGAGDWIEIEECKEEVCKECVLSVLSLSSRMMIVIFTKICSEHIVKIFDQYT
jgi:tRNA G18 (ribose-2'-O)-methylase SpoU